MKYPTQTTDNNAHVVAGVNLLAPTGTIRCRAWKLNPGGLAPTALTLTAPNDLAQQFPADNTKWSFDLRYAMEQESVGSFDLAFPQWEEHGVVIEFYDDGDATNNFQNKIVLGGGEDQIDNITGVDHRDLTQIYDALSGVDIWTALTGFDYDETGAQTTDTLTFAPFLQRSGVAVTDGRLGGASIEVYDIDGSVALMSGSDAALATTLTNAVNDTDTTFVLGSTAGMSANDVLLIEDELVEITSVDSGTDLTVVRGFGGTTAVAHGSAVAVTRSAADAQGMFNIAIVDTSALTLGDLYSLRVTVEYGGQSYTSSHAFRFVENDV